MALRRNIYGGMAGLWIAALLAACAPDGDVRDGECFFKASLTKANYSRENSAFSTEIGHQIAYAHFDGDIAYFPFATGFAFYFGGTCAQAAHWKGKIGNRLKIEDITREIYWADYKAHHEYKGIIPFDEEPEDE